MSSVLYLAHVLSLAVLAAMKTSSAAVLVVHVRKMVHFFSEAQEYRAALMQLQADASRKR